VAQVGDRAGMVAERIGVSRRGTVGLGDALSVGFVCDWSYVLVRRGVNGWIRSPLWTIERRVGCCSDQFIDPRGREHHLPPSFPRSTFFLLLFVYRS
jgi:hypothetical protein